MTSLALIGGQYGSEGKGVIAAGLAHTVNAAARIGGPNAGHSFYHEQRLYKMRSVPCAWINPSAALFIGAGAVIDPDLLEREVAMTERVIVVDPQAVVITPDLHKEEVDAGMRASIGSTTEGVGAARIAKIRRNGGAVLAGGYDWTDERIVVEPVAPMLWDLRDDGAMIMLEGTQGSALSLHHGTYPYVTSADTNAAQLAADVGLPPSAVEHTHLVIRTHPIRVAGNSGPTGGEEIAMEARPDQQNPERTTVTNNVRRMFTFSDADLRRAIMLNDPCGVWVTFGDYIDRDAQYRNDIDDLMDGPVGDWVREHIFPTGVRLLGIGVGGEFWRVIETGDVCHRNSGRHHDLTWPLNVHNHHGAADAVR